MNLPRLRLALAGITLSGWVALSSCGSSSGGSTFGGGSKSNDAGGSSGDGSVPTFGSSTSSSSGGSGGAGASSSGGGVGSSASSGGVVYTCTGCIDLNGACNEGGADNRCGLNSSTCVDCTKFDPPEVCGATGECGNGSANASSGGSGGRDAGGG
ncbi:MAG: hypothetical protein ACLP1X_15690 [Polyangiaceae bacterium]